ncbi:hypothetical protein [Streptomyces sp. NPDC006739]|uniref:hypothetical protein n=1 Tax=Streptomyces sp. NPDC006739 TaxID=3364763 RepID=UPI0036999CEA
MDWEEIQRKEIDRAISDALRTDPEIISAMRKIDISADELKKEIKKRQEELESAYSREFSRLQDLEAHEEAMQKTLASNTPWVTLRRILVSLISLGGIAIGVLFALAFFVSDGTAGRISGILILLIMGFVGWRAVRNKIRDRKHKDAVADRHTVLQNNLEAAWMDWRAVLRGRAVSGLLREEINRRKPSYSLVLDISDPKGLAELEDPQFLITVPAVKEINQLISTMPGGSIGISGPRGVGKTTLLRHFCSKEHAPVAESLADKPPVRVLIPAPVKYDAREFILLLFSRLCAAVVPDNFLPQRPREDEGEEGPSAYTPVDIGVMTVLTFAGCWGIFLLIISGMHWKPPAHLASAIVLIFASGLGWVFWSSYRGDRWRRADEFSTIAETHGKDAAEASALLRGLAYQQSMSRTWSTGIKTPVGVEAGVSANTTMTENPMGFPEIVARLNDFLRTLAVSRKIFIGIDELDKIDANDQVYQFINDIKGIFGREDCFYLISVSDNAMSSFERRGLPVRDAFDSSLDTVVDLGPAALSMSRTLMRQRVIGMPEAFLCLCHVISGGLPRDLIRAARNLVSLAKGKQESDRTLAALTRAMVRSDLSRKIHALEVAAQHIDLEPDTGIFLCTLHEALDRTPVPTSDSLLDEMDRITDRIYSSANDSEAVRSAHEYLNRLRLEMAAYFYFCSTLIGIFDNFLEEQALKRLSEGAGPGCLSRLAQVRSEFSVNPRVAWATTSAFRETHDLDSKPYPDPIPPATPTDSSR